MPSRGGCQRCMFGVTAFTRRLVAPIVRCSRSNRTRSARCCLRCCPSLRRLRPRPSLRAGAQVERSGLRTFATSRRDADPRCRWPNGWRRCRIGEYRNGNTTRARDRDGEIRQRRNCRPAVEGPVIFLWPRPVAVTVVRSHRGGNAGGARVRASRTHVAAHPNGALWRLLPTRIGPVARKSPSWVIEDTQRTSRKTHCERAPNSAGRAAVLRNGRSRGASRPGS
jgi:hypothetical protein